MAYLKSKRKKQGKSENQGMKEKKRTEQGTERRVFLQRREDKIGSTKRNRKAQEEKKVTD